MDNWVIEKQQSFERARSRAKAKATLLAMSVRLSIPLLTTFIIDTGAGVNLKCAASGLATSKVKQMVLQSANGTVKADRKTRIKFRRIGYHDLVLDNSPNVLSVGQLVKQGYSFHWTPGNTSEEPVNSEDFPFDITTISNERCYQVTPDKSNIELSIIGRVPQLTDHHSVDIYDNISEPDFEISEGTEGEESFNNANPLLTAPAGIVGRRLRKKSKVELTSS